MKSVLVGKKVVDFFFRSYISKYLKIDGIIWNMEHVKRFAVMFTSKSNCLTT